MAAHAQYSGSVEIASKNRYRGTAIGDPGPVVRASLMADPTIPFLDGAYAGVSGAWSARNGDLASAEALVGWSRRLNALPALSSLGPDWGWDAGVHLLHYGGSSRFDFHELMVGLLAPGWSARVWWSPHYFGESRSSLYGEVNGSIDLADQWRLFVRAGVLRYGSSGSDPLQPNRLDGLIGAGYTAGPWNLRLMRDGRTYLGAIGEIGPRRGTAAWVLSAGVAF